MRRPIWNGRVKGWRVNVFDTRYELEVELRRPLGELQGPELEAARWIFGESALARFSAFDTTLRIRDDDGASLEQMRWRAAAVGYAARLWLRPSYSIERRTWHGAVVVPVESADECRRVAEQMIAAGVPVVDKRRQPRA